MKPRQRPRAADSSLRQSQPLNVGSNGISDSPAETTAVAAATSASAVAGKRQQLATQQQLQSQPKQVSLLLASDEPPWSDERRAAPPPDQVTSLIDLEPETSLLANLDPLTSSVSTFPTAPFIAGQHYRPAFGCNMPVAEPLASSSDGLFNSLAGQSIQPAAGIVAYPSGMVPHHWLSYHMHGCAQQAVGHPSAVPYSPLRMMTPQYRNVVPQGKTGSNNDLHVLQVS